MKKNIKRIASIAFVALLATGCNGSEITKEQANERVVGIAKYQQEHATDLYSKGIYLKGNANIKSKDGKENTDISTEIWMAKNYFHAKINTSIKTDKNTSNTKQEIYVGESQGHFYYVDTVAKKYYDFGEVSETIISTVDTFVSKMETVYEELISTSTLEEALEDFPEGEVTTEGFKGTLKSKGEGHLYLEATFTEEENVATSVLIFNNYRFSSMKTEMSTADEKSTSTMSASYSVSAKMPSLNGMEKATVPTF